MKIFIFLKYENLWLRERGLSYFRKGNTIMGHMEFIWIMALDYATIIYGWDLYGSEIIGEFPRDQNQSQIKDQQV